MNCNVIHCNSGLAPLHRVCGSWIGPSDFTWIGVRSWAFVPLPPHTGTHPFHPHQLLIGNVLAPGIGYNLKQPKQLPGEEVSREPSAASTLVLGKWGSWYWRQICQRHHRIHFGGEQQRLWGCTRGPLSLFLNHPLLCHCLRTPDSKNKLWR